MKGIYFLYLSLMFIVCFGCNAHPVKTKVENKSVQADSVKIKDNEPKTISSDLILNKTFYYVTTTDTGDIVIDYYNGGLQGFVVTHNKIINFSWETFFVNIDSIVAEKKYLKVFISSENEDVFGETSKYTGIYNIKPLINKPGFINVDNHYLMVDSAFTNKTIPIVKEKPYDIEKAIGDY